MRVVSLYGKVGFHKVFLQLPFLRRNFCSMDIMVIWQRGYYKMPRAMFSFFS